MAKARHVPQGQPAQRLQALALKMSEARVAVFKTQSQHAGKLYTVFEATRAAGTLASSSAHASTWTEDVRGKGRLVQGTVAACRKAVFTGFERQPEHQAHSLPAQRLQRKGLQMSATRLCSRHSSRRMQESCLPSYGCFRNCRPPNIVP